MNLSDFLKTYGKQESLHEIPWRDFPEELREACLTFIDNWKEQAAIDDLRDLSGLNFMSVDELVSYSKNQLMHDDLPLGYPYRKVNE